MPRVTLPPSLRLLLLALVLAPSVSADERLPSAWELVARHLPGDAQAQLGRARSTPGREEQFLRATILIDLQPVTEERLRAAERTLATLASGDDEIACASAYLVGRLYQTHFPARDPARAAREFEQLAARHPRSYWAQLGLVKLALLRLYALPEPAAPAARLAGAAALLERITAPELKRDLHLLLGRARLFHHQPGALDDLLAGESIGGLAGVPRADLQIQIAELSRREGRWEQARRHFQLFLDENEVDARAYQVKMKLAEIAAQLGAGTEAPP